MTNLFKKALGAFVEFDEKESPKPSGDTISPNGSHAGDEAQGSGESGGAAAPVEAAAGPSEDLAQDPDIQRVGEAIKLLSSLPLSDIPAEKARELIVRTLQFAGMKPEELLSSFQRAQALYKEAIEGEQGAIAARQQQDLERLKLLETAIAQEKDDCAREVSARNERINNATAALVEIEKAMAFFATKESGDGKHT